MNTFKYILIIIISSIFISCELSTTVDLPPHDSKIALNGFITPDSLITITLSNSVGVLDRNETIDFLSGATVLLYEDENLVDTLNEFTFAQRYISDTRPQLGKNYSLLVTRDGYESVRTECILPQLPIISEIEADTADFQGQQEGDPSSASFIINDEIGVENYYEVAVVVVMNDPFNGGYIYTNYIESNDPLLEETSSGTYILSDEVFDGQSKKINFEFGYYTSPDEEYTLMVSSITKDNYLYKKTLDAFYDSDGNPFAEAVNVHSNVENGYGILAGYNLILHPLID